MMSIYNDIMTQVFSQMASVPPMAAPLAPTGAQTADTVQIERPAADTDTTLNQLGLAINREGGMSI